MTIKLFGYEIALTITKTGVHNRRKDDVRIEIDDKKRAEKVAEIVTDDFMARAAEMRRRSNSRKADACNK